MRGAITLLPFVVSLSAAVAAAAPPLPYSAFVTGDNVHVRSGPGMNYYPTDKLQKGDRVEVYRHDPGGWYAIRPPRNSFSWVSARHVEKTSDGLGRAKDDQAVARVGSRMSNVRTVVQVRLDRGEPVEILETFNGGGQTWYKIAPPAGEFRWMYARYLSTKPPGEGAPKDDPKDDSKKPASPPPPVPTVDAESSNVAEADPLLRAEPPVDRRAGEHSPVAPVTPATPGVAEAAPSARQSPPPPHRDGWQSRGEPRSGDPQVQNRPIPPAAVAPRPWQADRPAPADRHSSSGAERPRDVWQSDTASTTGSQIDRLEQQLSVIVAEEPGTWQFDELRQVAGRLLVDAGTATQRGRVRQVLGKIARFEEIQQRRVQMGLAPALVNRSQPPPPSGPSVATADRLPAQRSSRSRWLRGRSDPQPGATGRSDLQPGATGRSDLQPGAAGRSSPFDGIGTLRPVVSRRRDTPRYALVDNAGQVVSFVTPGPGLNLQPYVGRKIGIRGSRGYIPELRRTNVMARRITALDAAMVR